MEMVSIAASRKTHPYYIYAPPFRETSAGIVVLHTLCHLLNLQGFEAYIAGTDVLNPKFNTPVVTPAVAAAHEQAGLMPIVVYPEVVSGNPLNADVCVRYILNRIGFLNGKPLNEGKDDLFFYYSENFLGDAKKQDVDFLYLPIFDTEIFKPDPTKEKKRTFVFQYRYPLEKIDFSLFPPGTELISMANPVSLHELAAKLQTGRVLYSYEISAVCPEAMMCGCPVIFMHDGGLKDVPDQFSFGTNGAAMVSEKNGLARATATVEAVYPAVSAQLKVFWAQLPTFLEKTQSAARAGLLRRTRRVAAAPVPGKKRLAALSLEPLTHRWTNTRLARPFSLLESQWELKWPIQNNAVKVEDLVSAEALVMHRMFPNSVSPQEMESIFSSGKPVIYETNEPLHDLPSGHPLHFVGRRAAQKIEHVMRRANALVVSTEGLAQMLRPWNANVHVLPSYVDFDLFYSPVRDHTGKVRIGVMGSAAHADNFGLVKEALDVICERFRGDVHFVFVGALPPVEWLGRSDVTLVGVAQTYEEHAGILRQLDLDIGLMPLLDIESWNDEPRRQWLEYSAAGVATIGSGQRAYRELTAYGSTGLLVSEDVTHAWVDAIAYMIENPAQRRGIARTAQATVRKCESLQTQAWRYHDTYLRCISGQAGGRAASATSELIPAVLILDGDGDMQKIERSLTSHSNGPHKDLMAVVLTTSQISLPEWTDDLRFLRASSDEFSAAAEQVCAHVEFDWKAIAEAGAALQ